MADAMTSARRAAGKQLLALLDDAGLEPSGAGWVHDIEVNRWFFLLVTSLVDDPGPFWIYERLIALFRYRPLPQGIDPLDLRIFSPRERGIVAMSRLVHVEDGDVELQNVTLGDLVLDHAVLFRMAAASADVRSDARRFDARVQQLTTA